MCVPNFPVFNISIILALYLPADEILSSNYIFKTFALSSYICKVNSRKWNLKHRGMCTMPR